MGRSSHPGHIESTLQIDANGQVQGLDPDLDCAAVTHLDVNAVHVNDGIPCIEGQACQALTSSKTVSVVEEISVGPHQTTTWGRLKKRIAKYAKPPRPLGLSVMGSLRCRGKALTQLLTAATRVDSGCASETI